MECFVFCKSLYLEGGLMVLKAGCAVHLPPALSFSCFSSLIVAAPCVMEHPVAVRGLRTWGWGVGSTDLFTVLCWHSSGNGWSGWEEVEAMIKIAWIFWVPALYGFIEHAWSFQSCVTHTLSSTGEEVSTACTPGLPHGYHFHSETGQMMAVKKACWLWRLMSWGTDHLKHSWGVVWEGSAGPCIAPIYKKCLKFYPDSFLLVDLEGTWCLSLTWNIHTLQHQLAGHFRENPVS